MLVSPASTVRVLGCVTALVIQVVAALGLAAIEASASVNTTAYVLPAVTLLMVRVKAKYLSLYAWLPATSFEKVRVCVGYVFVKPFVLSLTASPATATSLEPEVAFLAGAVALV